MDLWDNRLFVLSLTKNTLGPNRHFFTTSVFLIICHERRRTGLCCVDVNLFHMFPTVCRCAETRSKRCSQIFRPNESCVVTDCLVLQTNYRPELLFSAVCWFWGQTWERSQNVTDGLTTKAEVQPTVHLYTTSLIMSDSRLLNRNPSHFSERWHTFIY